MEFVRVCVNPISPYPNVISVRGGSLPFSPLTTVSFCSPSSSLLSSSSSCCCSSSSCSSSFSSIPLSSPFLFSFRQLRTIPVILTNNHPKLGFKNQLVEVSAGYGRNYLIPHKLAIYATNKNRVQHGLARKVDWFARSKSWAHKMENEQTQKSQATNTSLPSSAAAASSSSSSSLKPSDSSSSSSIPSFFSARYRLEERTRLSKVVLHFIRSAETSSAPNDEIVRTPVSLSEIYARLTNRHHFVNLDFRSMEWIGLTGKSQHKGAHSTGSDGRAVEEEKKTTVNKFGDFTIKCKLDGDEETAEVKIKIAKLELGKKTSFKPEKERKAKK